MNRFRTNVHFTVPVNSNHVIADFWVKNLAIGPREEHVGFLQGHVAVDAIGGDFFAELGIFAALLRFVASQTARRERGGLALHDMHVVTGGARQSRGGLKALALAQHLDLIAMNVDGILGADVGNINVVAKIVSR